MPTVTTIYRNVKVEKNVLKFKNNTRLVNSIYSIYIATFTVGIL